MTPSLPPPARFCSNRSRPGGRVLRLPHQPRCARDKQHLGTRNPALGRVQKGYKRFPVRLGRTNPRRLSLRYRHRPPLRKNPPSMLSATSLTATSLSPDQPVAGQHREQLHPYVIGIRTDAEILSRHWRLRTFAFGAHQTVTGRPRGGNADSLFWGHRIEGRTAPEALSSPIL